MDYYAATEIQLRWREPLKADDNIKKAILQLERLTTRAVEIQPVKQCYLELTSLQLNKRILYCPGSANK